MIQEKLLLEDIQSEYEKHYNSIPYDTFIEIVKLDPQTRIINNEIDKIGPNASGLLLQRYLQGDTEFLNYGEEVYNSIDTFIKNRARYDIKNIRQFQNNSVREFINYVENPETLTLNVGTVKDKLTQIYDKNYSSIERSVFDEIILLDPKTNIEKGNIGPSAKNLLLPKYLSGEKEFLNDKFRVAQAIEDFEELKNSFPTDKQNINLFASVNDFINYVLSGPKSDLIATLESDTRIDPEKQVQVKDSFKLLGSTKNYDVIEVNSHLANNVIIGGTGPNTHGNLSWCTGYSNFQFNNYRSNGRLICFINKKEPKNRDVNYQLNIASDGTNLEFLNGHDSNPMSSQYNYTRRDTFLRSVLLTDVDLIPIVIKDKDLIKNKMIRDLNSIVSGSSTLSILEYKSSEDVIKLKDLGLTGLVKKIIIEEGITNIPDGEFENFTSVTEIKFPDSVKRIGVRSFAGCASLRKLILPKNLEIIEIGAFMNCGNLKGAVALPLSIKSIGYLAFENHSSQGLRFTLPQERMKMKDVPLKIAKEDAFWWKNPRHLRLI